MAKSHTEIAATHNKLGDGTRGGKNNLNQPAAEVVEEEQPVCANISARNEGHVRVSVLAVSETEERTEVLGLA